MIKLSAKQLRWHLLGAGFHVDEVEGAHVFEPRGCESCNERSYRGRVALCEVMTIDDELKALIASGGSEEELRRRAIEKGMLSLRRRGLEKVLEGITTIDEVVRETAR